MTRPAFALHVGDCLATLSNLPEHSLDSCVTDPPYHMTSVAKRFRRGAPVRTRGEADGVWARKAAGFMGQEWDGGDVAFRVETWEAVYRVLKPGAHLLAFGSTRGHHRMACAIEDAGFEIRDTLQWIYGSGFPKSLDVSQAMDRLAGVERVVIGERPGAGNGSMVGLGSAPSMGVTVPVMRHLPPKYQ